MIAPGSQAVTRYNALYEAVRTRRARPEYRKGLDKLWYRGLVRLDRARATPKWLMREAERVDAMAPELRGSSEGALGERVRELREAFRRGRHDAETVRRGLAVVREVARRETGEEAYLVQLVGALALYHGRVTEMLTGEGKTLTGSVVAPLLAWRHRRLHVFTVNDYLAARDAESRRGIFERCGLRVGAITQETAQGERAGIYALPVVFGTPKQITADYLRDQLRLGPAGSAWAARQGAVLGVAPGEAGVGGGGPIVPGLRAALVDEADAVLIDEGVVPLIIARSRGADELAPVYAEAARMAGKLDEGPDYAIEHVKRRAVLKRRGEHRCAQMFAAALEAGGDPLWKATRRAEELIRQALVARHCYKRGQQYEIIDGRVVIVDEFTGRFLADRQWEHGLHQSVEAKEGVEVTADRETIARISFQRFFRTYRFLCGMTGTAADATGEIEAVYGRPVVVVPTHRPVIREKRRTRVFRTEGAKWAAIVESVASVHAKGRPVLVGTRSIASSEALSERLHAHGLAHRVLNANFDADEAELIADAGRAGAITVATNMAGRGTDIKPDAAALAAGGLHVVLSELHAARRIDRQFIGRAGRQGDPGSSQVFASLEDELVRQYAPGLARLAGGGGSGEELTGDRRALAVLVTAQRRAEGRARAGRAGVLRQDDWIDQHLPGA